MSLNEIIATVLIGFGLLFMAIGIIGVYRFKFVINRMHCAAIIDTFGLGFVLAGLMVWSGSFDYIPKLVAIAAIMCVGSPIASHLVTRLETVTDKTANEHMKREDETNGNI